MASGSQETMAELLHGVEPVESKSLFPTFFHDALQERMGQVGGRDNEDVELSERRGAIIHKRSLVFRNAGTRRHEDISRPCRDPIKTDAGERWNTPEQRKEVNSLVRPCRTRLDIRPGVRTVSGLIRLFPSVSSVRSFSEDGKKEVLLEKESEGCPRTHVRGSL